MDQIDVSNLFVIDWTSCKKCTYEYDSLISMHKSILDGLICFLELISQLNCFEEKNESKKKW